MGRHPAESPAKKQSKWSADEDALIIDLRGSGMKWEDISKRLPGRSAISCRLHYQNYLERRSEWDEERKNKLARLYERFKPEMWAKVAEEMAVPWRAAEAMHWQLGEQDMARRAGVVPFSLSNASLDTSSRDSPTRGHSHSQSMSSAHSHSQSQSSILSTSSSGSRYHRPTASQASVGHMRGSSVSSGRAIAARRDSTPRSVPPASPSDGFALAAFGTGLPTPRGSNFLPSVAEMTTGVSPYSTPAYSTATSMSYSSAGTTLPSLSMYSTRPQRPSPEMGPREPSRRRQ